MKLLRVLLISILFTNILAEECKDPQRDCIKLCCDTEHYYSDSKFCAQLPDEANDFWQSVLKDETKEFVEYGECETQGEFAYIDFCYSPYYDTQLNQYTLRRRISVPCSRTSVVMHVIKAYSYIFVTSLCLAVMVIFAGIKSLKENFIFKLFSCYLATTAVTVIFGIAYQKYHFDQEVYKICQYIGGFSFITSYLWLNAIGFHIWYGGRFGNSRQQQNRFIYTLIYVWGIGLVLWAIIFFKVHTWIDSKTWKFLIGDMLESSIPFFNVIIFFVFSLNICITRCAVSRNIIDEHFKSKLFFLILRLFLMMGIPRMLVLTTFDSFNMGADALFISFMVEAVINFIVLLWKPKNCTKWKYGCCCFKKPEDIADMKETVAMQTTSTNC